MHDLISRPWLLFGVVVAIVVLLVQAALLQRLWHLEGQVATISAQVSDLATLVRSLPRQGG
jgi:hypothetical protein